jgi:hypothetical protein
VILIYLLNLRRPPERRLSQEKEVIDRDNDIPQPQHNQFLLCSRYNSYKYFSVVFYSIVVTNLLEAKGNSLSIIMVCIKCKRGSEKIEIAHLPGKVCEGCFLRIVEKRVRRDVRAEGWLQVADRIILLDDGTANVAVCRHFIEGLTGHSGIEIVSKRIKDVYSAYPGGINRMVKGQKERVVLPWNAEQESEHLLEGMITKRGFVRDDKRVIKLLRHVSRKEVEVFAKLLRLGSVREQRTAEPKIKEFLDGLEKDSPDLRFALIRAFERL